MKSRLKLSHFMQKSAVKNLCISFWQSCIALLYPPFCFHCRDGCDPSTILCSSCTQKLEPIFLSGRCHRCFYLKESLCLRCTFCKQLRPHWDLAASAFEYMGPSQSLIHYFKNGSSFLAKPLASFLYLQHHILDWPMPDLIVPVPQSFIRTFERGYDPIASLASELAKLMKRPCHKVLGRRVGGLSQSSRSYTERPTLSKELFFIKKKSSFENKIILLIDDIYASGATLNICSELLASGFPKEIYVLTIATCEYTKIALSDT